METPARNSFTLDGTTRVFPIPSTIKGDTYVRIEVDSVIISDRTKYDIVNNAIVFISATDVPAGSQLDVLTVQSEEAIGALGTTSSVDIVATNIANVNTTAGNIANINITAGSIANVNATGASIASVNTTATNIASINTNAANIVAIQDAAANAASALASKNAAKVSEDLAEADKVQTGLDRSAVAADLVLTDADTIATAADRVQTGLDRSATTADVSTTEAARVAAEAALDSFDDVYLGAKASDPALDNDGDALISGALYFNTTSSVMNVYGGSSWGAAYASLSGALIAASNLSDLTNAAVARTNLALGNVDNTSDAGKPVSSAQLTALNAKIDETATTGSAALPSGTTAQRDVSPSAGYFRYNSTESAFEGYDGSVWGAVGGGGGATGGGTDAIFIENGQTVTADYTIPTGSNAMSTGAVSINAGVTVTIPSGSNWVIL